MLEAALVRIGVVLIVLVLILKVGYIIHVDVSTMLGVRLSMWVVIYIIAINMSLVPWRTPVSLRYAVDIIAKEVAS